jgi:hypothetical protein
VSNPCRASHARLLTCMIAFWLLPDSGEWADPSKASSHSDGICRVCATGHKKPTPPWHVLTESAESGAWPNDKSFYDMGREYGSAIVELIYR